MKPTSWMHECNALCRDGVHVFQIWGKGGWSLAAVEAELRRRAAEHGDEIIEVRRAHELPPMDAMAQMNPHLANTFNEHGWEDEAKDFTVGYIAMIRTGDRAL